MKHFIIIIVIISILFSGCSSFNQSEYVKQDAKNTTPMELFFAFATAFFIGSAHYIVYDALTDTF